MENSALRSLRAHWAPAVRWALVLAATATVAQLAACGERMPLAPSAKQVANLPLPAAPSSIGEFGNNGVVPQSLQQAVEQAGGRIARVQKSMGLALVTGLTPAAANALRSSGAAALILPNVRRQYVHDPLRPSQVVVRSLPNTARASRLTPLADPRSAQFFKAGLQWNMTVIRADSAWLVSSQGAGMKVFILDSGVDTAHIDLAGRVNTALSTSFAFNPTDTAGATPLPFSHDSVGHGTFVSSLIASNSLGVAAVAPQAQLVMVRVLDDNGAGDDFTVISGILYAADNGADVVNVSLGGYLRRSSPFDLAVADLIQRAIDYATARGALVVAAAGNEGLNSNTASGPHGSYVDSVHVLAGGIRQVISVGATGPVNSTNFDSIAIYSNFGKVDVAVFAPGGGLVTQDSANAADLVIGACSAHLFSVCADERHYVSNAGTSFSSPLVAAEAAVIKAQAVSKPIPSALESCILSTADAVKGRSKPDINYNFGRIDVLNGVLHSKCK
ncbi:MAG TPA: S8 family serine peptidase [Gemmatimonadaceae bacterium]|nr:S8 family serine peptidase [Gemmatimonadaceae bacterium]